MAYNLWMPRPKEAQTEGSHPGIFRAGARRSLPMRKGSIKASGGPAEVQFGDAGGMVWSPLAISLTSSVAHSQGVSDNEWSSARTSLSLPDAVVEDTAGWLYSGMPHPRVPKSDEESDVDSRVARGYRSVPVPSNPVQSYREFEPSFKESRASPSLSDSTASPVWSARSVEAPSSQESTPAMGRRNPFASAAWQAHRDEASSASESSDAESAVPRSNSTASLRDESSMTPRTFADDAAGATFMPMMFPAPDVVPWADERMLLSHGPRHASYEGNAFAGLLEKSSVDPVAATSPQMPQADAVPHQTQFSRSCGPDSSLELESNVRCSERVEQTNAFASHSDSEDLNMARLHTMRARDMKGRLDGELRSIDDEMQDLMQDLLRLKDHVAAAKPLTSDAS